MQLPNIAYGGVEGERKNISSINELYDFKESRVWEDMQALLDEREKIVTGDIINASDLREIGFHQGELQSIQAFRGFVDLLIESTEAEIQETQEEEDEDES